MPVAPNIQTEYYTPGVSSSPVVYELPPPVFYSTPTPESDHYKATLISGILSFVCIDFYSWRKISYLLLF